MTTLTKTAARRVARAARQGGYYQDGVTIWVCCPRCQAKVATQPGYGHKPVRDGKPYSEVIDGKRCVFRQESATEALDRAMTDHLTGDCDGGAQ